MKLEELSLTSLKYFIDAVELQSLTLSAERNQVTRPAVSQSIVRLEEWVGKPLLEHQKRLFALTSEGVRFYQVATRAMSRMQSDFASLDTKEHSLKIGISSSVLDFILPKLKVHLKSPDLASLKIAPTDQLIQFMKSKSIHLAITVDNEKESGFKSHEIHKGFFVLRSKDGKIGERLILTEERPEVRALMKALRKLKRDMPVKIEVDSWRACQKLAAADLGACLVPDFLDGENLKPVSLAGSKSPYRIVVLARNSHELSDKERQVLHALRQ